MYFHCFYSSNYRELLDIMLLGNVLIIFNDFLFSKVSFSFVIELPFLKFIKYIFTEKSSRANAVKND